MAKDVKFLISANADQAVAAMKEMQAKGEDVSKLLGYAYQQLGTKSSAAFDAKRQAAQTAYALIKSSGQATNDELARSQQALSQRLTSIDEEQFGKRTSLLEKFKANWMGVTAAIGGAWMTISKGWDLANDAAKGIQQRQSFANLAASHNQSATKIINDLRSVSGETINTRVLVEKAGTAMILGIPADKLSSLMAVARASSKVTGQSVTEAFGDISLAVARGSRLILDNLGIIVSEEAAYKTYAAQIGKTAEQLSDTEKKTAFLNATLAAGKDIIDRVGVSAESMAEKMQRVEASMQNMREVVGVGLLSGLLAVNGVLHGAASVAGLLAAGVLKVVYAMSLLTQQKWLSERLNSDASATFEASLRAAEVGQKSLISAVDVISGKMDPLNSKMKSFQNEAKLAAEATEKLSEAKKSASESLSSYAKEVEKLASLQLKAAASGYSEDLKRQGDYLKTNNMLAANMSAPVQSYLAVIDQAYGRQLELQKQIGQALFKIGADQKVVAQQNVVIAQVERAAAEARLSAWSQYYDNLRAMHGTAMVEMKKSQSELLNIRLATGDLVAQVQQKMMTPMQQYYSQVAMLEEKQKLAQQLTSDEKIKMLQQVQQQWAGLSNEIKDGDQVLLSQVQAAAGAVNKIKAIGAELEQEKAAQINKQQEAITSLQNAMTAAATMVNEYQLKVRELDGTIAALTRTFSLTMKDEASPAIRTIKTELDQIRDKQVTISVQYQQVYGQSSDLAPLGSYASGTDYVPATGLYMLHRGEEVKNTARVATESKSSTSADSYHFNGDIVLPNVTNQTTARELFAEFQKLARRQAA